MFKDPKINLDISVYTHMHVNESLSFWSEWTHIEPLSPLDRVRISAGGKRTFSCYLILFDFAFFPQENAFVHC